MGHLKIANRLGDTRTNEFANINKTDAPQRSFSLGNNHITTANFGDLIPAYWCEARPRDKFELDANILAKFLALIAPAYTKADITVDWFFVPTKLISPNSLEFIQNQTVGINASQSANVFDVNSKVYGNDYMVTKDDNTGYSKLIGVPRFPCKILSDYLCSSNGVKYGSDLYNLQWFLDHSVKWRGDHFTSSPEDFGIEDINCFGNKYRVSRLLDYIGVPKSISTVTFLDDLAVYKLGSSDVSHGTAIGVESPSYLYSHRDQFYNPVYQELFNRDEFLYTSIRQSSTSVKILDSSKTQDQTASLSSVQTANYTEYNWLGVADGSNYGLLRTYNGAAKIDIRPFQAYQKIYNDYFRDPVKQDPIRLYENFVCLSSDNPDASGAWLSQTGNTVSLTINNTADCRRFINNIFSLRRRNYDKDWLNNSLLSDQLITQQNVNYQPFNSRFLNNLYKFSIKKALTGNRYFDFLANFMDSKGSDYLTNMVTYIGGNRFPITISETVQTSGTEDNTTPQGNRSGNMNAYQNTNKHYFSAPDFGYIMCIVSLLPKISYFNGLPQRLHNLTILSQDLPDFQNIGFQEVSSDELKVNRSSQSSNVFGYLPVGYQHRFVPDMITGDFARSLSYWHQSPDLDSPDLLAGHAKKSYSSFADRFNTFYNSNLVKPYPNNANFPAVGLKQVNNNLLSTNEYYNNIFAVTTDGSGDHCQLTMDFYVKCSRAMSEPELLVDDSLI